MKFDLDLFVALNEEYAEKRTVPRPMQLDPDSVARRAEERTNRIERQLELEPGQRVLEIGCGRGQLARRLADRAGVEVVGVDITDYPEWPELASAATSFIATDIVDLGAEFDETFDAAYSISVWEHIEHPAAALETTFRLLKPGGVAFVQAQLYGGPKASHRYREVFFPWSHILFEDAVFEEFYRRSGKPPNKPAYLNRWTDLHYRFHADRVGFVPDWWSNPTPSFDAEFYERFRERLSPFPVWDLSHDAIIIRLRKPLIRTENDGPNASLESLVPKLKRRARRVRWQAKSRVRDVMGHLGG